ncbi:MAG: hypothetical protein RI906_698 [Pseudomonadota bacterium]|jgi:predicted transcriptional regulator
MKLITATRLALYRAVKEAPGSITEIAARLHRDSAVKRDLDELEQVGLVTIAEKVLPGHGRTRPPDIFLEGLHSLWRPLSRSSVR